MTPPGPLPAAAAPGGGARAAVAVVMAQRWAPSKMAALGGWLVLPRPAGLQPLPENPLGGAPEVFFRGDVSDNCGQASTQQPRGLVAVKVKPSLAQILVFGERASCEKIKSGVDEERPH